MIGPDVEPEDGGTEIHGTTVSDLQEDVSISNNVISGNLKVQTSGELVTELGAGYFFAYKVANASDFVKVEAGIDGSLEEISANNNGVIKVNDNNHTFTVRAYTSEEDYTDTDFTLSFTRDSAVSFAYSGGYINENPMNVSLGESKAVSTGGPWTITDALERTFTVESALNVVREGQYEGALVNDTQITNPGGGSMFMIFPRVKRVSTYDGNVLINAEINAVDSETHEVIGTANLFEEGAYSKELGYQVPVLTYSSLTSSLRPDVQTKIGTMQLNGLNKDWAEINSIQYNVRVYVNNELIDPMDYDLLVAFDTVTDPNNVGLIVTCSNANDVTFTFNVEANILYNDVIEGGITAAISTPITIPNISYTTGTYIDVNMPSSISYDVQIPYTIEEAPAGSTLEVTSSDSSKLTAGVLNTGKILLSPKEEGNYVVTANVKSSGATIYTKTYNVAVENMMIVSIDKAEYNSDEWVPGYTLRVKITENNKPAGTTPELVILETGSSTNLATFAALPVTIDGVDYYVGNFDSTPDFSTKTYRARYRLTLDGVMIANKFKDVSDRTITTVPFIEFTQLTPVTHGQNNVGAGQITYAIPTEVSSVSFAYTELTLPHSSTLNPSLAKTVKLNRTQRSMGAIGYDEVIDLNATDVPAAGTYTLEVFIRYSNNDEVAKTRTTIEIL